MYLYCVSEPPPPPPKKNGWVCNIIHDSFSVAQGPLPRYVGNDRSPALVTAIVQQLLAYYTAINASELESPITCKDCLKRIKKHGDPVRLHGWGVELGQ